jgi:CRP/FNR family transcriptional regulator, cyclic AMP receptor protein
VTEDRVVQWRLLEGVPDESVQRLLQLARRRTFRRGEVVFHRGDPADSMHLVSKGRFAIRVMTPLGDQATISVRGPGESFGEMALVGEKSSRSATVEALEQAETFCVYDAEFARLRHEHPAVNEILIALLAAELRSMNERLLEALYLPVERRVLRRLRELAELYRRGTDEQVEIPLTQEEVAGLAGTSRATVNAVLGDAQTRGLVALRRGTITIVDLPGLATRAGGARSH